MVSLDERSADGQSHECSRQGFRPTFPKGCLTVIGTVVLAAGFLLSAPAPADAQASAESATDEVAGSAPTSHSVTRHAIEIDGATINYDAVAGTIEIGGAGTAADAELFYVAYEIAAQDNGNRPITFVFNGGPGAASAYLHLMALGPEIIDLPADGGIPSPPAKLRDNPETWLEFTDLVFIDPVGTGYSRPLDEPDKEKSTPGGGYWSYEKDLDSLAEFIRLYLTRNHRWASPKFLAGESYGGFRAASLPKRLASDPGIRLNGIVLVSPVLEFSLHEPDSYNILPWAVLLPAYAATAGFHGRLEGDKPIETLAADAETFAMTTYLEWLSSPRISAPDEEIPPELIRYLGLPADLVERHRGRISRSTFRKELLSGAGRLVSVYDSRISSIDPHPGGNDWHADDPVLQRLTAPLTSAFNTYVREELEYETDLPYRVLNNRVGRRWDWASGARGRPDSPGVAASLKEAMSLHDELNVFVGHGYYDLITPYLASKYVIARMALDPAILGNLRFEVYEGGHMYYSRASARTAFNRDIRDFFDHALAGSD